MRIEKKVEWVRGVRGKKERETFVDKENDRVYGRVLGAVGLPYVNRPGSVLTIAENFQRDRSIMHSPRHLYVLGEHESQSLEELHRTCLKFEDELLVGQFYGNPDSPTYNLWRTNFNRDSSTTVSITAPVHYDEMNIDMGVQLIRLHISNDRKTLHFGEKSKLPGYLGLLQAEDLEKEQIEHHPAVFALVCLLDQFNTTSYSGTHFVPDRRSTRPRGRVSRVR
jgi:hypothetical protein